MDGMTIGDLIKDGGDLLSWPVVVYLFREVQRLHRQRYQDQKDQLDLYQKAFLALKNAEKPDE